MRDCRKIDVWVLAHEFVLEIYKITKEYPKSEIYSLTSQLRRASLSIPANIAEGAVKASKKDYLRFLGIAFGSIAEVAYYLLLSKDLSYISASQYDLLENKRKRIAGKLYRLMEFMSNEIKISGPRSYVLGPMSLVK